MAEGRLEMDDLLEDAQSGRQNTIKEIFFRQIKAKHLCLTGFPPIRESLPQIILFYILTLGFYLYFWFYRIYRQIRNQKRCRVDPELRVMALFILTIVPFFLFGRLYGVFTTPSETRLAEWSLYLFVAGMESVFLLGLFQLLHRIMRKKIKSPFNLWLMVGLYFVLSVAAKSIPLDMTGYWFAEIFALGLQGGVLARVQNDLNHFWEMERELWEIKNGV